MIDGEAQEYLDDPDAWLEIPEFGVIPTKVDFQGFSSPVFGPHADLNFSRDMTYLIRATRRLAQVEFKTQDSLWQSYEQVRHQSDDEADSRTPAQRVAVLYQMLVHLFHHLNNPDATAQRKFDAMTDVAWLLTNWLTNGAKETLEIVRRRNAENASMPRPNARAVDHDEVLIEYRRLVREGHTSREARGILVKRGNMGSQATIYRVTNKK